MTGLTGGSALRRGLLSAVLALVAVFTTAAVASAATLTRDGGVLTYTATEGVDNQLYTYEEGAGVLRIESGDDPIAALPAGCTDVDGDAAAPHNEVSCEGTTAFRAFTLDGNDYVDAGQVTTIEHSLDLGAGRDSNYGTAADDEIIGGSGNDNVRGGEGNDIVSGGLGDDDVAGGYGDDTVSGGDGDDELRGGFGDDTINGDAGNDELEQDTDHYYDEVNLLEAAYDPGDDVWNGGTGIDTIWYTTDSYAHGNGHTIETCAPGSGFDLVVNVTLTQDGVANDGREGEADNLGSDIENVEVYDYCTEEEGDPSGTANVTLAAISNFANTANGNDTVNAGDGNDFVSTRSGNDTVNSVDGFADQVDCGENSDESADADVANVDEFDTVENCETVNVTRLGRLASEDLQPSITWTNPASDGLTLSNTSPTRLTVNATDDKGISQVVFLAGNRVLCTDTAAPFECDYTPTGDDVGETTLVAIAIDSAQQTAVALRYVELDRFEGSLSSKVSPKRDTSDPRRFRVRGKLTLPAGVSAAEGCQGSVVVRFKAGKKTISTKRAKLRDDCSYSVKRKFTLPERFDGANKLRVFARFAGNDVLAPDAAKTRKVTING